MGKGGANLGGRAPDHVIEVGGAETLERSIRAVKPGGTISMIGVLTGSMPSLNLPMVVMRQVRLQGVTVGSSESFHAMLQGIDTRKMKPMVDRVFAFTDLREAMHHMATGQAFGKIVIDVKSS